MGPSGYRRRSAWITPTPLFGGAGQVLVRLPAQEGRDVELVLFGLVMHRSLPAVLVEPLGRSVGRSLGRSLGRRTLGIFGNRLRTRFGYPRHRPPGQALR